MRTLKLLTLILIAVTLVWGAAFLASPLANAQPVEVPDISFRGGADVYSVKFLCGRYTGVTAAGVIREGPVKPGNYQTAINVHNPNRFASVLFRKKAVLMFDAEDPPDEFEQPMPPGKKVEAFLEPDWGLEIDCPDIRQVLLGRTAPPGQEPFLKGWVVIEVSGGNPLPLDVTAAYTAHGFRQDDPASPPLPEGFALEVLPVLPKRVK